MAHQSSKGKLGYRSREPSGAVTLLLTARIREGKRAEFLLSVRSLGPGTSFLFFEGIDDPEQVCATARLQADGTDQPYLASERFRALKGALRTLATGWSVSVLKERERWCAELQPERQAGHELSGEGSGVL